MEMDKIFGALADSTRRAILDELADRDGQSLYELCVRLIMLRKIDMTRQAISKHLAILEDANHNTGKIDAVPVEQMQQREEENLALVKSWMAKIPMDLDILILDEIGKNISGAGMDTKVVNRGVNGEYNPWPGIPKFQRVFVRDLSELGEVWIETGRAIIAVVGIGMRSTPGIAARLFRAVQPANVEVISQGASAINVTFVVREEDGPDVVRRLHQEFFGSC